MTEINLEHIKNSLAQATHYPWYWQENENVWQLFGGQEGHMQILKAPKHGTDYAEYWPNTHDSYLISNAPEWISSLLTTIEYQNSQIESLKAITELAVKGLKEIACLNVDSDYSAGTIARNTFSEIEKLQK